MPHLITFASLLLLFSRLFIVPAQSSVLGKGKTSEITIPSRITRMVATDGRMFPQVIPIRVALAATSSSCSMAACISARFHCLRFSTHSSATSGRSRRSRFSWTTAMRRCNWRTLPIRNDLHCSSAPSLCRGYGNAMSFRVLPSTPSSPGRARADSLRPTSR
jgi:hypothetical protein